MTISKRVMGRLGHPCLNKLHVKESLGEEKLIEMKEGR